MVTSVTTDVYTPTNVNLLANYLDILVHEYLLDGIYAEVNFNFPKVSQNLDGNEVTNAYHPKHYNIHTTVVYNVDANESSSHEDSMQFSDGGTSSPPPSILVPPLGKRAQRRKRQREAQEAQLPITSSLFATCTCDCHCVTVCFCGSSYCSALTVDPTETLIQRETDGEQIMAVLQQRYADIILFFHSQRGHINFRHVIHDFRHGIFDSDPYLEKDILIIDRLRVISHSVPPSAFICVTCPQYKVRKANRVTVSNRIYKAPFTKGYVDVIGPFPLGVGDARYILVFRDEYSNYGLAVVMKENSSSADLPRLTAWRLFARDLDWKMEKLHFDAGSIGLDSSFRRALEGL